MYINRGSGSYTGYSGRNVGFFGIIEPGAVVKDLGVTGYVYGMRSVGAVVGKNWGTVERCFANATVIGTQSKGVGGVVGANWFEDTVGPTIKNSYNMGQVTTMYSTGFAGGIAGDNEQFISGSYNAGKIIATSSNAKAGGIAGEVTDARSSITNTYYNADANSKDVGGFGMGYALGTKTDLVGLTTDDMKSSTLVGLLNKSDGYIFVQDMDNINNGFPIFSWQTNRKIPVVLKADAIDNFVGQPIEITFTDDIKWRQAITSVKVNGNNISNYSVRSGKLIIPADAFTKTTDYTVVIEAYGYTNAIAIQSIKGDASLSSDATLAKTELAKDFTVINHDDNLITGVPNGTVKDLKDALTTSDNNAMFKILSATATISSPIAFDLATPLSDDTVIGVNGKDTAVVVKAEDGTFKNYTITMASSNTNVYKVSTAPTSYTVNVNNNTIIGVRTGTVEDLKTHILVSDAKSKLKVVSEETTISDNTDFDNAVELTGETQLKDNIKVAVIAEDYTIKVYTISMAINDTSIKIADSAKDKGYEINDEESIITVPTGKVNNLRTDVVVNHTNRAQFKIFAEGTEITNEATFNSVVAISNALDLSDGMIYVVRAEDGTVKTYTIKLAETNTMKIVEENPEINDEEINGSELTDETSVDEMDIIEDYDINEEENTITNVSAGKVSDFIESLLLNYSKATIKILAPGTDIESLSDITSFDNAVSLEDDIELAEDQIVAIKSEDGTIKTYTIKSLK